MNASIETRAAEESVFAVLATAQSLIEAKDFHAAIELYSQILAGDLSPEQQGEVLTNIGAALCFSARGESGETAIAQLDRARDMLRAALAFRTRQTAPASWATTRANLAVVYLARFTETGSGQDLLNAHMALDGVDEALDIAKDAASLDWVRAIRDHLIEARDRRAVPR